jgi:ABC-type proline/glycine betaine transport system substrate-binding protein
MVMTAAAAILSMAAPSVGAPAKEKTVEGTVTNWNDATSSFQTKATVETWTFSFDKAKLQKVGTPAVGTRIKIDYHKNGKVYVADKVVVEKNKK